jgi:hypothetical protein
MIKRQLFKVALLPPVVAGLSCGPSATNNPCSNTFTDSYPIPPDAGTRTCTDLCGAGIFSVLTSCGFETVDGGPGYYCEWTNTCGCNGGACTGRRPPGLRHAKRTGDGTSTEGQYFADAARLEAASVNAFELLAHELSAHGAPASLRLRAKEAAHDEIRHAYLTAEMAKRHGAQPLAAQVVPLHEPRSLLEVALENTSEGLVRELFGAHVGAHQAAHAADPMTRALLTTITADELGHGQLAADINAWAYSRLPPRGRRTLGRRREAAIERLRSECRREPTQAEVALGLPSSAAALELADRLWRERWSQAA